MALHLVRASEAGDGCPHATGASATMVGFVFGDDLGSLDAWWAHPVAVSDYGSAKWYMYDMAARVEDDAITYSEYGGDGEYVTVEYIVTASFSRD